MYGMKKTCRTVPSQQKSLKLQKELTGQFAETLRNDIKQYLLERSGQHDPVLTALNNVVSETTNLIEADAPNEDKKQSALICRNAQFCMNTEDHVCIFLQKLLLSANSCNIILQVEEEEFLAHKHILSSRSTFFAAMFNNQNHWSETESKVVNLGSVEKQAFAIYLCHLYGAFVDISAVESFLLSDFASIADMYNADDLLRSVALFLKQYRCHFFHKPCADCLENFPEALLISSRFNMPTLKGQCLEWSAKYFARLWCTEGFCSLPAHPQIECCNALLEGVTIQTAVAIALEADALLGKLTSVEWKAPVLRMTKKVTSRCNDFIAAHLYDVAENGTVTALFQDMGSGRDLLKNVVEKVAGDLTVEGACLQHLAVSKLLHICKTEASNQEVTDLIKRLEEKTRRYLNINYFAVVHSEQWLLLPTDLREELQASTLSAGDPGRKLASKPVLSSSKASNKPVVTSLKPVGKAANKSNKHVTPRSSRTISANSRRTTDAKKKASLALSRGKAETVPERCCANTAGSNRGQAKKPSETVVASTTGASMHERPALTEPAVVPSLSPVIVTQELTSGSSFFDGATVFRKYGAT